MENRTHTRKEQAIGTILLLITATVWGFAFVAQKVSMDSIGPFTFNSTRYLLGCLVLIPFVIISQKKIKTAAQPSKNPDLKYTLLGGAVCGFILAVSSALQQIGIQYTSIGKTGFITTLYIFFVPLIGIFFKRMPSLRIWICVVIAVIGFYVLCMSESFSLAYGDTIVLLCAIGFSFHIIAVDHFVLRISGVTLACLQFFFASIISGIAMLITERPSMESIIAAAVPILYAGCISAGVGYTLQVLGQAMVSPARASLLMSLESVFSVIGGFLLLHEMLSLRELVGCAIVFIAVVLAQTGGTSEA